ncbi:hypothetical protein EJB05_47461, partial [Eragrostis curvula]
MYANLVQTPWHPPLPEDLDQLEVVRVRYERGESSCGVTRAADDPGAGSLSEEVWASLLLEDDDDVDDPLPEPDEVGVIPRVLPDPVGDEMSVIPDAAGWVVLQTGMAGGESAGLGRSRGTERSAEAPVRLEWGPDFWVGVGDRSFLVEDSTEGRSWDWFSSRLELVHRGVSSARGSLESALHALEETRPPFEVALEDSRTKSEWLRSQGERLRHWSSERAATAQAIVTAEASRADLLKEMEALRRRAEDAEVSLGASQERAGDAERRAVSLAAEVKAERGLREVAEVAFANLSSELAELRDQNGVLEQELLESQAVVGELDNLRLAFLHSCSQLGMKVTNDLHETTRQVLALPTHVRALEENVMEGRIRLSFAVVRSHYEPDVGVELMSEGFAEGVSPETLAAFEEEVRPDVERLLAKYKEEFLLRPPAAED